MFSVFDRDAIPIGLALAGGFLCLASGLREVRGGARERLIYAWWGMATVCFAIAAGHLLNAGGGVAESGRDVFRFEGLYGSRRPFQAAVVAGLMIGGGLGAPFILRWVRANLGSNMLLPVLVLGGLVGFLAVRTISLHAIDSLLYGHHIFGGHPGSLVEAAGLALFVAACALASSRRPERPRVPTGVAGAAGQ